MGLGDVRMAVDVSGGSLTVTTATVAYSTLYDVALAVAKNVETDIISITVPSGKIYSMIGVGGLSLTDTVFKLYINNVVQEVRMNAWTNRNVTFIAKENVAAGIVIKLTGIHSSDITHDFHGTIVIDEKTV